MPILKKKSNRKKDFGDNKSGILGLNNQQEMIVAQIEAYSEKILPFLPREIQDYPSHGIDHSKAVINLLNGFIKRWSIKVTNDERFLLYLAAWTHDLGRICRGEHHNKISVKIIERSDLFKHLLSSKDITCLKKVVESHSQDYDITDIPKKWDEIRLQLICAIFRIIDAMEMDSHKCPKEVFDLIEKSQHPLDPSSRLYWIAHMNVQAVGFEYPEIVIGVEKRHESDLLINKLKKEIESVKYVLTDYGIEIPTIRTDATSLRNQ